jgi:hypothetical protein
MSVEATADPVERAERVVHTQLLFRLVNEQVRRLAETPQFVADFEPAPSVRYWVCECSDAHCTSRVPLKIGDYLRVRRNGAMFIVAPSDAHVEALDEVVVERGERHWIIEKIGRGRAIAEQLASDTP